MVVSAGWEHQYYVLFEYGATDSRVRDLHTCFMAGANDFRRRQGMLKYGIIVIPISIE